MFHTSLFFVRPDELHRVEKPYAFKFPLENAAIPSKNYEHIETEHVQVSDIRGHESDFTLEKNGFAVFDMGKDFKYEDFHDSVKIEPYFHLVEKLLKQELGASHVQMFRYGLRKRHPTWPRNTGQSYDYDQPTTTVHIDTTPQEVLVEVRRHHKERYEELTMHRVQWVNVWKPLRGPLNDWPLLVCDNSTVDKSKDLEPADLLYPDRIAENCLVYDSPKYRWHYLSGHKTTEIMVFKQGDTLHDAPPGVPHCSVQNPLAPNESPRESIETRFLVFYNS
ncbi:putative CmcJ-like methyltransferase [Lophiotrema nucula]|uniref:Putative CmcJ-like methyltransferase n=1 Tax=Lophiotrema nucula TaxID=690887 RepID=A0A6A5ZF73_9PLEO|nr:putative CmcJ-like methyltransferase [Lophiotrema nucula]